MFILTACQGNKDKSYSGEIMLSSELFGSSSYYVQGYSFESEEFVSYPGTSPAPDILVENLREPGGDIVAAGFSSPGNSKAFLLHGSYNSAAEAESAYEAMEQADTLSTYTEITDTLYQNQVWLYHSITGHYAKILIRDISGATGLSGLPHFELLIRYRYQPDDTALLTE